MNNSIIYLDYIDLLNNNRNNEIKLCEIYKKIKLEKDISEIQRKILFKKGNKFLLNYIFDIFYDLRFGNIEMKTKKLYIILKCNLENNIFSRLQKKRIYLFLNKIYTLIIDLGFDNSNYIIDFNKFLLKQRKIVAKEYSPFYKKLDFVIINDIVLKIRNIVLNREFYLKLEILYKNNFLNNHNYINNSYKKSFWFRFKIFFRNKKIYKIYRKNINYNFNNLKIIKKLGQNSSLIIKLK